MAAAGPNTPNLALFDVPFHGFWLVDTEGATAFANQTLNDLMGGDVVVGSAVAERVDPADRDAFTEAVSTLELGVADALDLRLLTASGEPVAVRLWLSPRTSAAGEYEGYVAIVQERVELAEDPAPQLVEAGQITQYLTAGVAHSLNTSLQAILGYAGLVLDDDALGDSLKGPMQSLYGAAGVAARLVSHLLSLTDLGDNTPAALGFSKVLSDAVMSREAYFVANNVSVIRPTLEEEAYVWANPPKLRRAMTHLLTNASSLALAQGGGTIHVMVDAGADMLVMGLETLGHRYSDDILNFETSRFGANLAQDVMTYALAVGLVRDLGGRVEAVNTDTGARLLVALPRASAETVRDAKGEEAGASTMVTAPPSAMATGPTTGLPRVLVVDDEAFILELSEHALKDVCEVTTVGSADAAQALLETERFSLIVSDLRMPGVLDGLGLFEWARTSRPDLVGTFVFTTADTVSRQAAEFLMTSGRPCLQKPFDVRNYRRFISEELGRVAEHATGE